MSSQPRTSPNREAPYAWVSRAALRKIREADGKSSGLLVVYLALAELASEAGKPAFPAKVSVIAFRAGLSYSSAFRLLPKLAELGLVGIAKDARDSGHGTERMPSFFTLFSTQKAGGGLCQADITLLSGGHNPFCQGDRKVLTLPKGRELIERKEKEAAPAASPSALGAQGEAQAASQDPNVW